MPTPPVPPPKEEMKTAEELITAYFDPPYKANHRDMVEIMRSYGLFCWQEGMKSVIRDVEATAESYFAHREAKQMVISSIRNLTPPPTLTGMTPTGVAPEGEEGKNG